MQVNRLLLDCLCGDGLPSIDYYSKQTALIAVAIVIARSSGFRFNGH